MKTEVLIEQKIKAQILKGIKPKILFLDLDGTIFKENYEIIFAPFYNLQTLKLLKTYSIPFCIVTGRLFWNNLSELEMYLHGFPKPDVIILKDGAEILFRTKSNKLVKDYAFLKGKLALPPQLLKIINSKFKKIDSYLYVTYLNNFSIKKLLKIKTSITNNYKNLLNLSYSEGLRKKNTRENFSGTLFLKDKNISKYSAVEYLISNIVSIYKIKLDILIFGDASIDIPMLSLKNNEKYNVYSFLVNPKPLAESSALKNRNINIFKSSGPKVILKIIKNITSNQTIINQKKILNKAQNNKIRKLILFFEPLLNYIINQKLSANEVSILGLKQTIKGIDLIYKSKNIFKRIYGFYLFLFGEFIDVLDGIRSRNNKYIKKSKLNSLSGQLVDGFSDRAKEFYYFYKKNPTKIENALSCILPSIARATNELLNQTVSEKDEGGGSMLDRIYLMFKSIFFYILGFKNISSNIDKQIYQRNLATFENRISNVDFSKFTLLKINNLNIFQKKALTRLAFYLKLYEKQLEVAKIKNNVDQISKLEILPIIKSVNLKTEEELFKVFKRLFKQFIPINKSNHTK